uniref:Uncharacterized protein n=1 Tax=Rhizophora mucronata TaxID=61149 RepID=A0A2P2JQB3_RHIMU
MERKLLRNRDLWILRVFTRLWVQKMFQTKI